MTNLAEVIADGTKIRFIQLIVDFPPAVFPPCLLLNNLFELKTSEQASVRDRTQLRSFSHC